MRGANYRKYAVIARLQQLPLNTTRKKRRKKTDTRYEVPGSVFSTTRGAFIAPSPPGDRVLCTICQNCRRTLSVPIRSAVFELIFTPEEVIEIDGLWTPGNARPLKEGARLELGYQIHR